MDKKQMYVQVVNLSTGKIFSLPTLYTDRTEACVCGQNFIRDRQAEKLSELIFFRILDVRPDGTVAPSYELWDDEDDCECPDGQEVCFGCPNFSDCWEEYEEEDDDNGNKSACQASHKNDVEEPDWRDYCDDEEFINYFINLMKKA